MSITTKFAATTFAALALAAVVSLATNQAHAKTKGPSPHPTGGVGKLPPTHPVPGPQPGGAAGSIGKQVSGTYHPGTLVNNGNYHGHQGRLAEYCYWLPTVSNGSVSGLKPVCYWTKN
jgi:hypothetical protein